MQVPAMSATAKLTEQFEAGLVTREDFTIDQPLDRYAEVDHAVWSHLFARQTAPLVERFADAPVFGAGEVLPSDIVLTRGTGEGWTSDGDV